MRPRARGGVERDPHAVSALLDRNHRDRGREPSDLAPGVQRASGAWRRGRRVHSRGRQRQEQYHLSFTRLLRARLRFQLNSLSSWTWITFRLDCIVSRLVRITMADKLLTPRAVGVRPPANAEGQIPNQSTESRH